MSDLQKTLSTSIQHQILSQLKSLPDLTDCLAVLVIAIGFLVSSPCQPDMHISKYLHSTLSLPPERGIQASSKVIRIACVYFYNLEEQGLNLLLSGYVLVQNLFYIVRKKTQYYNRIPKKIPDPYTTLHKPAVGLKRYLDLL